MLSYENTWYENFPVHLYYMFNIPGQNDAPQTFDRIIDIIGVFPDILPYRYCLFLYESLGNERVGGPVARAAHSCQQENVRVHMRAVK